MASGRVGLAATAAVPTKAPMAATEEGGASLGPNEAAFASLGREAITRRLAGSILLGGRISFGVSYRLIGRRVGSIWPA